MAKERTELQREIDDYIDANKQPGQTRKQFLDESRQGVAKGNVKALSTLNDLKNMIIRKEQIDTVLNIRDEFLNRFIFDAPEGNGALYTKHFIKPGQQFEEDKFVPDRVSDLNQKSEAITFKNDNGQLMPNSRQWKWEIVTQLPDLITYFRNGQLTEFLQAQVRAQLDQSVKVYVYDQLMTYMKQLPLKTINGTATNTFDAITLEVLPAINRMTLNSNEFNFNQTLTEAIDASDKSNLIMIYNTKTDTVLKSHVMSQLFNSSRVDLNDYVGHKHISNYKFNLTTTTVESGPDFYCPEDEIWVIDAKDSIKMPIFFKYHGQEKYDSNVSKYNVTHLWFTIGHLSWGKGFKYKNANLNNSPATP